MTIQASASRAATPVGTKVSARWLADLRDIIGELPVTMTAAAIEQLRLRLGELAWLDGCPQAANLSKDASLQRYRRQLVASGAENSYTALLIAWPPGHRTPLHDHDGLWGIELVVDGALQVEEYRSVDIDQGERATLSPQRRLILGIGDAAAFSGHDYVHACHNLSANHVALSLHVYGGALEQYARFDAQTPTHYRITRQRAELDVALI